ncbi:NAD/NADP octopine/nopaline dehydrogenase family protein [Metallumcola ferriviriculae]|uniref:NAD/NADP octopine/nopaline dehydrogenase family protein n=1 Tax=Metallumcola ferriviriculae TaxID=3039180 RepID=A0AAU0ULK1_9FIRM|nr:NAD/NADP octopine/nopaline dehydrogenase family protein [Desulfitibacteraceae bacterium MK1]
MKVAVLGSGNGGCAVAFRWAKDGHDVFLFDFEDFPDNIDAISKNGGIYSEGQLKGFTKVKYAGHDIRCTVDEADIIFAVGPAYSTEAFAKVVKPYLKPGQTIIVCPGSCGGAIVFKNALGLNLEDEKYIIAETSTLPYAVRVTEPGKIRIFLELKGGVYLAALPSKNTEDVYKLAKDVFPMLEPAKNVFQTTLQNGNPVIHPAVVLLNAGLVDRTNGDFYFYEEGVTKAVGRLIEGLDNERIALGKELGLDILAEPVIGIKEGYMQEATYDRGYIEADGFKGIKALSSLDSRFFNEDVAFGLVFMSELGKRVGVKTPTMDAVIEIASVIMRRDYRKAGERTPKTLGLDNYSISEIMRIL